MKECPLQKLSYLVEDERNGTGERVYHAALPESLYLELVSLWNTRQAALQGTGGEFVMVPKEITIEMQKAYFDVIDKNLRRVETDATFGRFSNQQEAYRAMLAAAPKPACKPTDSR